MNRQQRRASSRAPAKNPQSASPRPVLAEQAVATSPSLMLRFAASILLSAWVLKRVRNPQVFSMLRQVAIQAGRDDAARSIDERMRQQGF